MLDPSEGMDPDGYLRTGAHRSRVPAALETVVAALTAAVATVPLAAPASLYLYGSTATGTARVPDSDVDAITIGLPIAQADALATDLSKRFAPVCRGVEIAAAQIEDYTGEEDEAFGNRAFLRHYCVHLAGPDPAEGWPAFPADSRVARGFNGDLAECQRRWLSAVRDVPSSRADADRAVQQLARRVARKTLLAVAGLVSVHDDTWTTDRASAATRWAQLHPSQAAGLRQLKEWSEGSGAVDREDLRQSLVLGGVVQRVVVAFGEDIGMWR